MDTNAFSEFFEQMLLPIIVVIAVIVTTIILKTVLNKYIAKNIVTRPENATNLKFLNHSLSLILFTFAGIFIIYNVPSLRTLAVSLFAGAGILVVIVGLASQQAFSNIVSGIFIVMFKPFKVNDRIELNQEHRGVVEDITLRHTVIRNFENKRIIIPNSLISSQVIVNQNFEDNKICRLLDFGISYDSDAEKAMKIMKEVASEHPLCIDNRSDEQKANNEPKVIVRLIGFGDSSVNLRAFVWADDPPSAFIMGCDLNLLIKKRFDAEGIEIPFPYRTLVFKNPAQSNEQITVPPMK